MNSKTKKDDLAQRIARHMHGAESTSSAWSLKFEDAGEGWARASMIISEDMLNGHGTAHGGVIFSLADTVFAWACNSRNQKSVAQNASISFLSPVLAGERLVAEAHEVSMAGRSGVFNVVVKGEDGRSVAVFQGLSRTIRGTVLELNDGEFEKEDDNG